MDNICESENRESSFNIDLAELNSLALQALIHRCNKIALVASSGRSSTDSVAEAVSAGC